MDDAAPRLGSGVVLWTFAVYGRERSVVGGLR